MVLVYIVSAVEMPYISERFRQCYSKDVFRILEGTEHFSIFLYFFPDWHCPSATCWSCWGTRHWQGCWQRNPRWCPHAPGSCRTCWASPRGWRAIPTGEVLEDSQFLVAKRIRETPQLGEESRMTSLMGVMIVRLLLCKGMYKRYSSQLNLGDISLSVSPVLIEITSAFPKLDWETLILMSGPEPGN